MYVRIQASSQSGSMLGSLWHMGVIFGHVFVAIYMPLMRTCMAHVHMTYSLHSINMKQGSKNVSLINKVRCRGVTVSLNHKKSRN